LKLTDGETLSSVKDRIQSYVDTNDKEFDKWKFSIVSNVPSAPNLSEENDPKLYLSYFHITPSQGITFPKMGLPWLGLDHLNKNPKRTRYNFEKAIKIHN
jgi:ubiquitin carboxyl-terminal hydrolase 7